MFEVFFFRKGFRSCSVAKRFKKGAVAIIDGKIPKLDRDSGSVGMPKLLGKYARAERAIRAAIHFAHRRRCGIMPVGIKMPVSEVAQ